MRISLLAVFLLPLIAFADGGGDLSGGFCSNALARVKLNAYADVETSYHARGKIVDKNPFSAQYADLAFDLEPFGKLGGYAWSVSSMAKSGQSAVRRNFYNEVDYAVYYDYALEICDGWALDNTVARKWVTLPGYRPHANTIHEWNFSQALVNPYVTPYYLLRSGFKGGKWNYWDVGLMRSWELCDRLTFSVRAFCEFGDGRLLCDQYGANPRRADGDYAGGITALNLVLRLDYALTDHLGIFAFVHLFDIVNGDVRDANDKSSAPESLNDLTIGGVGLSIAF